MSLSARDERTLRYVDAAVTAVLGELASATSDRNAALNKAAFALGTLMGAGAITEDDAVAWLTAASDANGYARKDGRAAVRGAIRSGLQAGSRSPRKLPEPQAPRSHPLLRATRNVSDARPQCATVLPPERRYPPIVEVEQVLRGSRVDESLTVRPWLTARRIDAGVVADRDFARALGRATALPTWASCKSRDWLSAGYHLVLPLYDSHGDLRSVLARNVVGGEPKSVAATGFSRGGLVLACPLAREILKSAARPTWWPHDVPLRIEICEGEKKFLMRASRFAESAEFAPAVMGIESGSWTDEIAARLPSGCTVYVATDQNAAGAKYATRIVQSLISRLEADELRLELRDEFVLRSGDAQTVAVEVAS